jgi:hypothetical protein
LSEDAINRLGTILEQLGTRFELVLEELTGFGGKLDGLRNDMTGHFADVGRQIRFISDRIAENRGTSAANRADLGAEMVRLGEMLGATRIEFREQLGSIRSDLNQNAEVTAIRIREQIGQELERDSLAASSRLKGEIAAAGDVLRKELIAARSELGRELPGATDGVREEIAASSSALIKKIDAELKQTNKSIASLTRKFERFDDRVTVETRDQDQRLRKLERKSAVR